jgi:soluble lytic murein transglycosylase-like protein
MTARLTLAALVLLTGFDAAAASRCQSAIAESARRHGVPEAVALTVGKVESGHDELALNIAGRPARAYSSADAVFAIGKLRAAGITSVDVGCMQINLKHHPRAFPRLEQAFEPEANAEYGVQLLKRLHGEKLSWGKAIAAYHSSDPERQTVYLTMVRQALVKSQPPQAR